MFKVDRPEIGILFSYRKLYWPAQVDTSLGPKNGVEIKRSEDGQEVVWVSSHGEIYRSTPDTTDPVTLVYL